ncbi:MAG: hypothetical protein WDZ88_02740 [Candidatus Paceibacterota bacterium]
MITEELVEYIKSARAGGIDDESIKNTLATEGGWPSADIEEGFNSLGGTETPGPSAVGMAHKGLVISIIAVLALAGSSALAYVFFIQPESGLNEEQTQETQEASLVSEDEETATQPAQDTEEEMVGENESDTTLSTAKGKECNADAECFIEALDACMSTTMSRLSTVDAFGSDISVKLKLELVSSTSCDLKITLQDYNIKPGAEIASSESSGMEAIYEASNKAGKDNVGKSGICNLAPIKEDVIDLLRLREEAWLFVDGADFCTGPLYENAEVSFESETSSDSTDLHIPSDWKTYANSNYHFEIQHPSHLIPKDDGESVFFLYPPYPHSEEFIATLTAEEYSDMLKTGELYELNTRGAAITFRVEILDHMTFDQYIESLKSEDQYLRILSQKEVQQNGFFATEVVTEGGLGLPIDRIFVPRFEVDHSYVMVYSYTSDNHQEKMARSMRFLPPPKTAL